MEGQQLSRKVAGNQWMPVTDDYLVDPVEGLDVVTTLNLHLQDVATTALERQLRKHDAAWGTVIVCEVQTGHIQAISNLTRHESTNGTVEYWEDFNHAIGTAVEPGSTFKLATLWPAWKKACCPRIPWTPNKAKSTSTESACATAITRMEATEKSTC